MTHVSILCDWQMEGMLQMPTVDFVLLLTGLEISTVWHNNSVRWFVYCISEHSFNGNSVSIFCFLKIEEIELGSSCMKPSNSILHWHKYLKLYVTKCDLDLLFLNTPTFRTDTACRQRFCQLNQFFAAITLPWRTHACLWQRHTATTMPLYMVRSWTLQIQKYI